MGLLSDIGGVLAGAGQGFLAGGPVGAVVGAGGAAGAQFVPGFPDLPIFGPTGGVRLGGGALNPGSGSASASAATCAEQEAVSRKLAGKLARSKDRSQRLRGKVRSNRVAMERLGLAGPRIRRGGPITPAISPTNLAINLGGAAPRLADPRPLTTATRAAAPNDLLSFLAEIGRTGRI